MNRRSYLQRYGDVELAVRRSGRGLPLVWGHGLMGSMRVEDLAGLCDWSEIEQRAQLVRYDARCHGNSDGSYEPEDDRWQEMARDMLTIASSVAKESGARRFVLGGLSMGAATALEAAVQQPDQVAGLILALPPTAWDTRPRQAAIYRRMSWVSGVFGAAPYRLLDWLPTPVRDDGRSRMALHTIKGLARANPLHVQAALRGASLSDMPEPSVLKTLKMPALILAWEDDWAHPVCTAEILAESLHSIHALHIASPHDPLDWTGAICEFMDSVSAPKRKSGRGKRRSR
jgi:pimeloyl-ACP methyl ester carboxylesterase